MTSRHLIDPEILPVLEMFPELQLTNEILPAMRASFPDLVPPPDLSLPVTLTTFNVPGPSGAPPVRLLHYRPNAATGTLPAIFHIHGGGYVLGTPEMSDNANRAQALDLGCAIFSVDYRLAPETPFPGAIEDCYAALAYIVKNAATLNIDPARIGIKGESAGGGLAASLALLVRDRAEFSIAFQHLIYPMLDDRDATSTHPYTGEFIWTRASSVFGWGALLGEAAGGATVSPYAAASRAENLAGLPPCFLYTGTLDLFLDEIVEYALRLTRAGVPTELHLYPGAFHGFEMAVESRVSIAATTASRAALRRALHG